MENVELWWVLLKSFDGLTPSEIPRTRLQQASRRRAETEPVKEISVCCLLNKAKERQESPIVVKELDIFRMFCVFRDSILSCTQGKGPRALAM
jgi:hypothetical protein